MQIASRCRLCVSERLLGGRPPDCPDTNESYTLTRTLERHCLVGGAICRSHRDLAISERRVYQHCRLLGCRIPLSGSLIEHWNGVSWSIVSSPNVGKLIDFRALPAPVPRTAGRSVLSHSGHWQTLTDWVNTGTESPGRLSRSVRVRPEEFQSLRCRLHVS